MSTSTFNLTYTHAYWLSWQSSPNEVCCISNIKSIIWIHRFYVCFHASLLNTFLLSNLYIPLRAYRAACFHTHILTLFNGWLIHLLLTFMPTYLSICLVRSTDNGGPCIKQLGYLITLQQLFECLHVMLSILFCPSDFYVTCFRTPWHVCCVRGFHMLSLTPWHNDWLVYMSEMYLYFMVCSMVRSMSCVHAWTHLPTHLSVACPNVNPLKAAPSATSTTTPHSQGADLHA